MNTLGLPFLLDKHKIRYERSVEMRAKYGVDFHYRGTSEEVEKIYLEQLNTSLVNHA